MTYQKNLNTLNTTKYTLIKSKEKFNTFNPGHNLFTTQ